MPALRENNEKKNMVNSCGTYLNDLADAVGTYECPESFALETVDTNIHMYSETFTNEHLFEPVTVMPKA